MVTTSRKVILKAKTFLGKILSIIGYAILAFILLGVIAFLVEDITELIEMIPFFIIFSIPGIVCVILGRRIKMRIKRFKRYVSILSFRDSVSIEDLAVSINKPFDFVRRDVKCMIDKKYFTNAYIDANSRIIIAGRTSTSGAAQEQTVEMISFICPNCVAPGKKAKDSSVECDYCGTIL